MCVLLGCYCTVTVQTLSAVNGGGRIPIIWYTLHTFVRLHVFYPARYTHIFRSEDHIQRAKKVNWLHFHFVISVLSLYSPFKVYNKSFGISFAGISIVFHYDVKFIQVKLHSKCLSFLFRKNILISPTERQFYETKSNEIRRNLNTF